MEAVEARFLRYVAVDTASREGTGKVCPSTDSQFILARMLTEELKALGFADARTDERCYVYASLPASKGMEDAPAIGLIAHLDTVDDVPSSPVRARQFLYEGGDIVLNAEKNIVMRESEYEGLRALRGEELIVTDGQTLLGADDKAGVAEIMAVCQTLSENPDIRHSAVKVAFTPDEEIGSGADCFDVKGFGARYAYTVDGGAVNEMEYENFNAASAIVQVQGFSIHPGTAKNKMRNASRIAMEFHAMLPANEIPEATEGYEGFYHLVDICGQEDHCTLKYIIRDHDMKKFTLRKERIQKIADYINDKYGAGTIALTLRDSYYNMRSEIEKTPWVIDRAMEAIRACGLTPKTVPIRGGTDGARLSFMGLPCPNLGTGGGNGHGVYEYVSVTQMRKMVEILCRLVTRE